MNEPLPGADASTSQTSPGTPAYWLTPSRVSGRGNATTTLRVIQDVALAALIRLDAVYRLLLSDLAEAPCPLTAQDPSSRLRGYPSDRWYAFMLELGMRNSSLDEDPCANVIVKWQQRRESNTGAKVHVVVDDSLGDDAAAKRLSRWLKSIDGQPTKLKASRDHNMLHVVVTFRTVDGRKRRPRCTRFPAAPPSGLGHMAIRASAAAWLEHEAEIIETHTQPFVVRNLDLQDELDLAVATAKRTAWALCTLGRTPFDIALTSDEPAAVDFDDDPTGERSAEVPDEARSSRPLNA